MRNAIGSQVVCPYLDENEGACRIYSARPIACRSFGFFVGRDGNDYCQIIENELSFHPNTAIDIVWGNAQSIRHELEKICGVSIPFDVYYQHFNPHLSGIV